MQPPRATPDTATRFVYPEQIAVAPLTRPVHATLAPPGSKSITNRALILAALANGHSRLHNALDSDDTRVMLDSLRRLGFRVIQDTNAQTIDVEGLGGRIPAAAAALDVGNSGTSTRFLTALCALGDGTYHLDGVTRMRQRPQGDLLHALTQMGVAAHADQSNGCPPLTVRGTGRLAGGNVRLNADASSQFVTALLLVAPYADEDITLEIEGSLRPHYVAITQRMMQAWGADVERNPEGRYRVRAGQTYRAQTAYTIEPDASGASYLWAAAAISGGRITVPGLHDTALQGDVRFATEILSRMNCTVRDEEQGLTVIGPPPGTRLHGLDVDMGAISDTALTLAALAPFADRPTTVRGIAHSRLQECDRIAAACTELRKLGVPVDEHADGYTIYPLESDECLTAATVETYHDHRVAMSFALIGLRTRGVTINDPACVAKTFPGYWHTLDQLRSASPNPIP